MLYKEDTPDQVCRLAGLELTASMQVLKSIMDSTEEEFLMLGSRISSFSVRSEKIVDSATSVVKTVSGETITDTIGELNSLMERVSRYIDQSEREIQDNIRILQDILRVINTMLGPLGKLQGITRKLRALGISTMIQHASLKASTDGFRILGEDIRNLSEVINNHSRTIVHQIQSLNVLIRTSISRLQTLFDSQREKASAVLKQTMTSILSLNDKYDISKTAAGDISAHFDNVTKSIRQIVTMLQVHDIARQQVETVHAAFAKMTERLHEEASRRGGMHDAAQGDAATAREVILFCRTQSGRIRQIRNEFFSSIEKVRTNLKWIAANILSVIRKAGQITQKRETAIESFLTHIESTLTTVSSTLSVLSENIQVRKELSDSISPVVDTTGEISAAMQEIQHIGREIQFISFNSAIKSNHVGGQGRGLGVISAHIQDISSETQDLSSIISEMLGSISLHVNELTEHLESHIFARNDVVLEMSGELKQLIRTLNQANTSVVAALEDIDHAGTSLSREISAVVDSVKSGSAVNIACDTVLDHLESLKGRLEQRLRDEGILLYGGEDREHPAENREQGLMPTGEFGENVELF